MEVEERCEKLVQKCIEKDKYICRLGNLLRGCHCGIVTSALLDELCVTESQLEKFDYLEFLNPPTHPHSRIRLQGDASQLVSVPPVNTSVTKPLSWSHVGTLGAISSQILEKQDDRQDRPSTEAYHNPGVDGTQFVPVSENRSYPNTSGHDVESFVPRSNLETDNRYSNEGDIPTAGSQYTTMSQVVSLTETDQFHSSRVNIGAISDGYESGHLQSTEERHHVNTESTAGDGYSGTINGTNNRYPPDSVQQSEGQCYNLELAYQNLVDNVSYPAVSPAESQSEIYTFPPPVMSMQMSDNRIQLVTSYKTPDSQHTVSEKSKPASPKPRRETTKPVRKQQSDIKRGYQLQKHRCDVCGKCFGKPSKLCEHVRVHTGEKPFKCSTCQKCFAQSGTLKYHMRIHSGEKPFTCSECGKTFTQPGQLSSHKLIHREKSFKCHLCKKSFPEEVLLERHVKIHKKERPHKCDQCGKCFLHSGNLFMHLQKCCDHDEDLKCKECGELFTSKDDLVVHDKEHSNDKPHQCDICLKRFKRPLRLKKHKSTHIEVKQEKSHMCDVCGQCYGKPSLLKIHMRIHTGEKPFMCDVCGKFLGSANNLRRHVLSHTGERNFKCKECSKTFSTAHNLEYHSRVHTGLKPFKCDTCGKCFPFSFSLDRHMRTHKRLKRT